MSTNSEITSRAIRDAVNRTFDNFRSDFSQWEYEVERLLEDVAMLLAADAETPAPPSNSLAEDVATLRGLVEQQTDVLSALVNALTGEGNASSEEPAPDIPSDEANDEECVDFVEEQPEVFECEEEAVCEITEDLVVEEA